MLAKGLWVKMVPVINTIRTRRARQLLAWIWKMNRENFEGTVKRALQCPLTLFIFLIYINSIEHHNVGSDVANRGDDDD